MPEAAIICPQCWDHAVEPIQGVELFALQTSEPRRISDITVYRCQQWHVFAIFKLNSSQRAVLDRKA